MQAVKTIGLDIAKSGFQVHGVDALDVGLHVSRRHQPHRMDVAQASIPTRHDGTFWRTPGRCDASIDGGRPPGHRRAEERCH
jgi:hypothetical protein